jgi:ornithine carbamoyltransferase
MIEAAPPVTFAKDFLSILDLSSTDLDRLLALAAQMKADRRVGRQAAPSLAGLHVALLFEKPSLRTRSTFEIAIRELGGDTLHLPAQFAEGVREPLKDIARNLERWVRALVIRTYEQEKAAIIATAGRQLHVINALTDEEHPCQALADAFTLRERWGDCRGRTVAFVGDGNNVATSLAHVTSMLGVTMHVASPGGFELPDHVISAAARIARDGAQVRRFRNPHEAVAGVDAVYTDVWTSMGEEAEADNRRRAFAPYQVNDALMSAAAPHALFMHCLPAHRGEEATSEVIDSAASVVFDQAENRLHTQKALLQILIGRS